MPALKNINTAKLQKMGKSVTQGVSRQVRKTKDAMADTMAHAKASIQKLRPRKSVQFPALEHLVGGTVQSSFPLLLDSSYNTGGASSPQDSQLAQNASSSQGSPSPPDSSSSRSLSALGSTKPRSFDLEREHPGNFVQDVISSAPELQLRYLDLPSAGNSWTEDTLISLTLANVETASGFLTDVLPATPQPVKPSAELSSCIANLAISGSPDKTWWTQSRSGWSNESQQTKEALRTARKNFRPRQVGSASGTGFRRPDSGNPSYDNRRTEAAVQISRANFTVRASPPASSTEPTEAEDAQEPKNSESEDRQVQPTASSAISADMPVQQPANITSSVVSPVQALQHF